jgi:hypothetical protein
MKLKRRSQGQSSRAAGLLLCVGGVLSCSTYATVKNLPIDCTADSGYDFMVIDNYEVAGPAPWFSSADLTSDAPTAEVDAIPGARCNSNAALVLRSSHHNDWGSLFGINNFGPRDASAYEGVSFWARAPGNTTKSFTILTDDLNSNNLMTAVCGVDGGTASPGDGGAGESCTNYCISDGGTGSPQQTVDPMTGMVIGGSTTAAPPADACGNSYQTVQVVAADWRFYTVPFRRFQQAYTPNRVPNPLLKITGSVPGTGLRTSALTTFTLRMPKEAEMELWIDNLAFYRKKATAAGTDGGPDAN